MPKKIDSELKARAVRLATAHLGEYPSLIASSAAVAMQLGVGKESVRRWVVQAEVDGGQSQGATPTGLGFSWTTDWADRHTHPDHEQLAQKSTAGDRLVSGPKITGNSVLPRTAHMSADLGEPAGRDVVHETTNVAFERDERIGLDPCN